MTDVPDWRRDRDRQQERREKKGAANTKLVPCVVCDGPVRPGGRCEKCGTRAKASK